MRAILPKPPLEKRDGVILVKNPTYLKIVSSGRVFNAHTKENSLHYPVGARVEFEVYSHVGTPSARILKVVNPKEAYQFLVDLHKDLPAYQIFRIEEIFPSVHDFARTRGLKYMGPVLVNNKTRYLFL